MAHAFGFEKIFGNSNLHFVEKKVRRIGADAAVVHGRWQVEGQNTGGGSPVGTREGIFIFVMERQGAIWKAAAAQNTDIISGHESIAVIDGQSVPQSYHGGLSWELCE